MENNYFVLYDFNDNIICYIDNIYELVNYLPNYRLRDIKRRFLNSKVGYIGIVIDNVIYKLYRFI